MAKTCKRSAMPHRQVEAVAGREAEALTATEAIYGFAHVEHFAMPGAAKSSCRGYLWIRARGALRATGLWRAGHLRGGGSGSISAVSATGSGRLST